MAPTHKQRSLHEFYSKSHVGHKPTESPKKSSIPGLTLLPNFVEESQERELLAYLDSQPWRTDLSRRTMHFGGTYCLLPEKGSTTKPQVLQAPCIPPAFGWLLALFVQQGIYSPDDLPQYCIINEYREDQGISPHVENFSFGEPVCSLSLGDNCPMRFQELAKDNDGSVRSGKSKLAEKTGRKHVMQLPGRSLLVLRGEARRRWQHEIPRSQKDRGGASGEDGKWRRVSLTFRVKKR